MPLPVRAARESDPVLTLLFWTAFTAPKKMTTGGKAARGVTTPTFDCLYLAYIWPIFGALRVDVHPHKVHVCNFSFIDGITYPEPLFDLWSCISDCTVYNTITAGNYQTVLYTAQLQQGIPETIL